MDNIDEHLDEHLAAKAKQEAEDYAWNAMYDEALSENWRFNNRQRHVRERKKTAHIHRAIYWAVLRLIKTPKRVMWNDETMSFTIDGKSTDYDYNVRAMETGSMWHRKEIAGKYRVIVGDYGDRTNYPQRKDGSHNYEEIARTLIAIANRRVEENKMSDNRNRNKVIATELQAELGLQSYTTFARPSADSEKPIFVHYEIHRAMTVDEARALFYALKELGIMPTY